MWLPVVAGCGDWWRRLSVSMKTVIRLSRYSFACIRYSRLMEAAPRGDCRWITSFERGRPVRGTYRPRSEMWPHRALRAGWWNKVTKWRAAWIVVVSRLRITDIAAAATATVAISTASAAVDRVILSTITHQSRHQSVRSSQQLSHFH